MKNSEQREKEAAGRRVEEDTTGPGRVFHDAPIAPEMVVIPAGDFLMGSPEAEKRRYEEEGPQHRVVIPTPFALGKYAVTFEEFDHFVSESGHGHHPDSNRWSRGSRPVIDVNWDDAVAYCRWLSEETGHDYRLPTEAEWEYACRAGTTTPFYFGETIGTDQANYDGNYTTYGNGLEAKFRKKTMKVGQFPANAFGLHEMHGNVWEWCADCHEKDAYDKHIDVYPNMVGDLESSGKRVIRGGSWINRPKNLRSATRTCVPTGDRYYFLGFRIARTL